MLVIAIGHGCPGDPFSVHHAVSDFNVINHNSSVSEIRDFICREYHLKQRCIDEIIIVGSNRNKAYVIDKYDHSHGLGIDDGDVLGEVDVDMDEEDRPFQESQENKDALERILSKPEKQKNVASARKALTEY